MALSTDQSNLVDRTLIKLDALDAPGSSIVGGQGEVYQVLKEASRQLILEAPSKLLYGLVTDGKTDANDEIDLATASDYPSSSAKVFVPLLDTFLRLMGLRLTNWSRTLFHSDLEEGESADGLVFYEEGGDAPSVNTPVAYLVYYSTDDWAGSQAIQAFPGSDEASPIDDFRYIPVTAPESLPSSLTEPLLWKAAALISRAVAPDIGGLCDAEYARAMGIRSSSRMRRTTRAYRGI